MADDDIDIILDDGMGTFFPIMQNKVEDDYLIH
jgi:hypothetical protein